MKNILAQSIRIGSTQQSSQEITGPLVGINNLADLVNKSLTFLIPFAGIILFFVLIWGGYDYLLSQGNPEKTKSAQAKLTAGIIGFVLLVASYLIVKLIASIFGLGQGIL